MHVCQCADRIADYDSTMIENLLEFDGGFSAFMRGLATHLE
jgi:hypothetical protein